VEQPAEPVAEGSLLRSVVDSLDGRMCVISARGTILDTNRLWDEASRRLGWTDAAAGGDLFQLLERLPGPLAEPLRQMIEQVLGQADTFRVVRGVWPFPAGDEDVVARIHPVRGHTEARAAVIVVDISDYMRTRAELRRTSEQARLMSLVARHTDSGVVISAPDGRVEWANDSFYSMTGWSAAEFVGLDTAALYREALKEAPELSRLTAAFGSGNGGEIECRLLTRRGWIWVHLEVRRARSPDGPDRVVSVMRNITTRRLAEDQLREANREAASLTGALQAEKARLDGVIETLPHLIYLKDNELRYRSVNAAFLRTRGLRLESDLIGRTEAELALPDPLSEALLSIEAQILATGQPVTDLAVTLSTEAGKSRMLLLSVLPHRVRPVGGGDEELHGLIGVGADITHVTELERQLAQSSRLEAIGQLAAGIAHEINTPIQFIHDNTHFVHDSLSGLVPVLRVASALALATDLTADELRAELARTVASLDLDYLTEEVPHALTQSLEGLERVTEIVRATKDFSHPGRERADADLNRAIENTVQMSRSEWKYVARLELLLDPAVGLVPCYEGELKQVLLNIIINAAQALAEHDRGTGRGGLGHIQVSTRRTDELVRIEISDDGPGMAPEVRRRVFDPFFTTKDVGKGTGQGLSMAYNVVVGKHQGTIEVESAPGRGASFVITLPLVIEDRNGAHRYPE
jgi:PAS domain S-box-containing protein